MHLVVFGGGGKCARHVARLRGEHEVTAVVRDDKQCVGPCFHAN